MRRALGALAAVGYHVQEPLVINAADHLVPQQRFRLFIVGTRRSKNVIRLKNQDYQVPCYSALRADLDGLPNHETRDHRAESVLRYMALRYGERDHLGRVDRLDPRLPSKTVIAGGTKGGGRSHLHPSIPRTLSVRECARLQTFPDDYSFVGPTARQFTQVGNAVPPVLAAQFAWAIKTSWFD
jgi:DNA (cytosine-5)-methyltransferase 1